MTSGVGRATTAGGGVGTLVAVAVGVALGSGEALGVGVGAGGRRSRVKFSSPGNVVWAVTGIASAASPNTIVVRSFMTPVSAPDLRLIERHDR